MRPRIGNAVMLFIALSLLLGFAGASQAEAAEVVRINGSGATLDIVEALAKEYRKRNPAISFVVDKPLGSSGAVKALLAGALDIVVSSKVLKREELARGAQSREYGKLPFAVVTAGDVGKNDISTMELEEIYAGKMTRWPNGETIRIILRPKEDIDTKILAGLSPRMERVVHEAHERPGMILAVTDPEANEDIAKTPGGLGTAAVCCVRCYKGKLKALSLNGKPANAKGVADGSYPLAKDMRFIITRNPTPAALDFLRFVYSDKGRAIARAEGVVVMAPGQGRP